MASVEHDHAVLRGSLASLPMQSYDVHEMASESGAMVREYAARGGTVFAVTWSGSQVPDLKLLLGSYYENYLAAAKVHPGARHLLSINAPNLVMTVVRSQRSASGQVYLPQLMPRGVTRRELR